MSITTRNEKGLYEESMLTGTLEERDFLDPLHSTDGIEHVGWFNTTNPIFKLTERSTAREIAVQIADLATNGEMGSAGLRAFIIPADLTITEVTDIFEQAVVFVKIENWGDGCLPNQIIGKPSEIKDYIRDREKEMSENMRQYIPNGTVELDDHAVWGWDYGQYQFVAWR